MRDLADEKPAEQREKPQDRSRGCKVFLLTDGRCGSACDDFVDAAQRFPNVVHVGAATDVDSPYMEARPIPLPSGIAT